MWLFNAEVCQIHQQIVLQSGREWDGAYFAFENSRGSRIVHHWCGCLTPLFQLHMFSTVYSVGKIITNVTADSYARPQTPARSTIMLTLWHSLLVGSRCGPTTTVAFPPNVKRRYVASRGTSAHVLRRAVSGCTNDSRGQGPFARNALSRLHRHLRHKAECAGVDKALRCTKNISECRLWWKIYEIWIGQTFRILRITVLTFARTDCTLQRERDSNHVPSHNNSTPLPLWHAAHIWMTCTYL